MIRDILHRLADRFPTHVIVWPVRVQGESCAAEIAAAIAASTPCRRTAPSPRPDLLIVARGGGSVEDLWSFNEEVVVRAAAESIIPLISAVGHETDVTLIDYAADRRAPTPTGAAEMAVPVRGELIAYVDDLGTRQRQAPEALAASLRDRLRAAERGLPRPADLLATARQRLDNLQAALPPALARMCNARPWFSLARARAYRRGFCASAPAITGPGSTISGAACRPPPVACLRTVVGALPRSPNF